MLFYTHCFWQQAAGKGNIRSVRIRRQMRTVTASLTWHLGRETPSFLFHELCHKVYITHLFW